MNNNDRVSIREVYQLTSKLEEKIDLINNRLSNLEGKLEGKASIISIFWSSTIGIVSILFNYFLINKK